MDCSANDIGSSVHTNGIGIDFSICAITAYRIQVTSTVGTHHDDHAINAYATVSLLTCLEAILGVITTCLPVLKPILSKIRVLTEKYSCSRVMRKSREGNLEKAERMGLKGGE